MGFASTTSPGEIRIAGKPPTGPFARAYGLTRDHLRYILDPANVLGPDYPSETFRVLKKNDIAKYGDDRTARLVLAAWDARERAK
jgi:hypothetical protein